MDKRVELIGFRDLDSSTRDLIDKNISQHLVKLDNKAEKLENLHITLKKVHVKEKSEKYEVQAKLLDNGKLYVADYTERNLLEVIDRVLEKLFNEMGE